MPDARPAVRASSAGIEGPVAPAEIVEIAVVIVVAGIAMKKAVLAKQSA